MPISPAAASLTQQRSAVRSHLATCASRQPPWHPEIARASRLPPARLLELVRNSSKICSGADLPLQLWS